MELTRAAVSFHTLLCSVWAISHHSSMSSPLSDPSGKLGQRTVRACHHSNSMPGFISLVISQNVFPPLVSAFGLLNEPFQFEPCCLMSPPPPPLFPPPPALWKHGDTVSVYTHWCMLTGQPLFETVFSVRLKDSWSLLQPGRDQDESAGHRCLQGPPGPPGPQGPEVSLA